MHNQRPSTCYGLEMISRLQQWRRQANNFGNSLIN